MHIHRVFDEVAAKRAKDARNSNRSGAAARRRKEKTARKQRYGYLYAHADALGRLIKIGYALANNGQRGRGAGTATFWPSGLGRMTVRVELGVCTEAVRDARPCRAAQAPRPPPQGGPARPPRPRHPPPPLPACLVLPVGRGLTSRGRRGCRWCTSTTAILGSAS
jgi:hypothetical protein